MKKLLSLLPVFDIGTPDGELYLRRYTLLKTPWFKIMIHHILRPDYTTDFHDHPWAFLTLIISGGYIEKVPDGERHRKPGKAYYHPLGFRHAISELPNGDAWTLVFRGPRKRDWGFYTKCGWQYWEKYVHKFYNGLPICEDKS